MSSSPSTNSSCEICWAVLRGSVCRSFSLTNALWFVFVLSPVWHWLLYLALSHWQPQLTLLLIFYRNRGRRPSRRGCCRGFASFSRCSVAVAVQARLPLPLHPTHAYRCNIHTINITTITTIMGIITIIITTIMSCRSALWLCECVVVCFLPASNTSNRKIVRRIFIWPNVEINGPILWFVSLAVFDVGCSCHNPKADDTRKWLLTTSESRFAFVVNIYLILHLLSFAPPSPRSVVVCSDGRASSSCPGSRSLADDILDSDDAFRAQFDPSNPAYHHGDTRPINSMRLCGLRGSCSLSGF